jgi:hypothetical protein
VLLSRIVAPSQEAEKALGKLGLSVASFRDAEGKLLPMVQIVGLLSDAMRGMSTTAQQAILADKALVDVFGDRGIKVIGAFADMGVEGFGKLATEMEGQRTVSEKFGITMSGLSGAFETMQSSVERLAVAFGIGLAPSLTYAAGAISGVIDGIAWLLNGVPTLSPIISGITAVVVGLGISFVVLGWTMGAVQFAMRGYIAAAPVFTAATASMTASVGGLTAALASLRVAFFALPVAGQIALLLAGLTAIAGAAWWLMSPSSSPAAKPKAKPKKNPDGIHRDQFRQALDAGGRPMGGDAGRGDTIGTFSAAIAGQLGIGPKLQTEARIADNTGRTADGVEQLVAMGGRSREGTAIPSAAALARGVVQPGASVATVAGQTDRDLLTANERAALASEKTVALLREILQSPNSGGMAFA